MNEKDYSTLIKRVANAYAIATNADTKDKQLATFILKNYYGCDTFFLNKEGDLNSGLNMNCISIFIENMELVKSAISGERN